MSFHVSLAGYNKYVEVIGNSIGSGACANVNRKGKIYKIEDDTKFLHLLSERGEENDWLHIVIADIVRAKLYWHFLTILTGFKFYLH